VADKLGTYRSKRDTSRTPEPVPEEGPLPHGGDDTFVIQEHHAAAAPAGDGRLASHFRDRWSGRRPTVITRISSGASHGPEASRWVTVPPVEKKRVIYA
jgi:hypothetical protein